MKERRKIRQYETCYSLAGFLVLVNRLLYLFDFRLTSSSSVFAELATRLNGTRPRRIRGFDLGWGAVFVTFIFFDAVFCILELLKLYFSISSSTDIALFWSRTGSVVFTFFFTLFFESASACFLTDVGLCFFSEFFK